VSGYVIIGPVHCFAQGPVMLLRQHCMHLFPIDCELLNTEPSIGASHQVSAHLAKQFQRRRFLEIDHELPMVAMFPNESG
jgi:hypothetical protein